MKTWEVKLDTKGNGLVTINVQADDWHEVENSAGDVFALSFYKHTEDGAEEDVAFYPMATLLGVKDVTP